MEGGHWLSTFRSCEINKSNKQISQNGNPYLLKQGVA
jgi:hypothetical protein